MHIRKFTNICSCRVFLEFSFLFVSNYLVLAIATRPVKALYVLFVCSVCLKVLLEHCNYFARYFVTSYCRFVVVVVVMFLSSECPVRLAG